MNRADATMVELQARLQQVGHTLANPELLPSGIDRVLAVEELLADVTQSVEQLGALVQGHRRQLRAQQEAIIAITDVLAHVIDAVPVQLPPATGLIDAICTMRLEAGDG